MSSIYLIFLFQNKKFANFFIFRYYLASYFLSAWSILEDSKGEKLS